MRSLIGFLAAAFLFATSSSAFAETVRYDFSGNFVESYSGLSSNPTYVPYTGAFGGTMEYDTVLGTMTSWDVSMDFRYNGGTIETINFVTGGDRQRVDISATAVTFRYSFSWSSNPRQNRIRLYLDDTSNWGDDKVTFDFVWGDQDTLSSGNFVGTSPHNNTTGRTPVAIVAASAVPLPAGLPLVLGGLGALYAIGRRKRAC